MCGGKDARLPEEGLIFQGSQDIRHQAGRSPSRRQGLGAAAGLQPRSL